MVATRVSDIQASNIIEGSRKRARGAVDSGDDATPSTSATGTIERRINVLTKDQVTQYGNELLGILMTAVDPSDKTLLCEPFLKLPSRRQYPDYYEIIKKPMTLEDVKARLDQVSYSTLPDVKHDCEIVCMNAKRYNQRESAIWLKAKELHSLIKLTYVRIVEGLPEPPAGSVSVTAETWIQGAAAASAPSPRVKRITLRPSRSHQQLSSVPKAEETQIEIPPQRPQPVTPGQPQQHQQQHPAAALLQHNGRTQQQPSAEPEQDDDDDDADGDDDDDDGRQIRTESPGGGIRLTKQGFLDGRKRPGKRGKRLKATLRGMITALRKVIGKQGHPLTMYFDELPSRKDYPEYFQIITRPISLSEIEGRVFKKEYVNAHALFLELELMLNNAQYFNEEGSVVWNDAQEIRAYLESVAIPSLIEDGFTLEKDDVRQSALPLHLAANSTIEAHKTAYRLLVAKTHDTPEGSASPVGLGHSPIAVPPPLAAASSASPHAIQAPVPLPPFTMSPPAPVQVMAPPPLPSPPTPAPRPVAVTEPTLFEGEKRLALIPSFSVDVHIESSLGRSIQCASLRLANNLVKHHTVHLSSCTTFVVVQFPLRVLKAPNWPWQPAIRFNDQEITATYSGKATGKMRLLPKRGMNVLEVRIRADAKCEPLKGLKEERYCLYLSC